MGGGVSRAKFAGKSQAMPLDSVNMDQPSDGEGEVRTRLLYLYCQVSDNLKHFSKLLKIGQ